MKLLPRLRGVFRSSGDVPAPWRDHGCTCGRGYPKALNWRSRATLQHTRRCKFYRPRLDELRRAP